MILRGADTIVLRAVTILIAALLAALAVGYVGLRFGIESTASAARDRSLAERMVSIKRAIASTPDGGERDRAAHALSSQSLDVHWSRVSLVLGEASPEPRAAAMAARLRELVPELGAEAYRVSFADDGALGSGEGEAYRHMMLVSIRLDDSTFVNFASPVIGAVRHPTWMIAAAALVAGGAALLVSAMLMRWVARPLRRIGAAATRFSPDKAPERLDEAGPREVRQAAQAFNAMGQRIRRLVDDRTQALAAVSHDLRTPITRIRLRADALDDDAARAAIDADLAEMETMIDATLDYLRAGESGEATRVVDVASMLQTLVDDRVDLGARMTLVVRDRPLVRAQPVALKRALANIIGNAAKYAGVTSIETRRDGLTAAIDVLDDGPGVPVPMMERVFEPFVRVETSRSRETGGVGLGLTIARSILRANGGEVVIANRCEGGLRASIRLPAVEETRPAASVTAAVAAAHGI